MKAVISVLTGIAVFLLCIWGASSLINGIVSGFDNTNYRTLGKIVIWLFAGGFILVVSIAVSSLVGKIVDLLLESKPKRRR